MIMSKSPSPSSNNFSKSDPPAESRKASRRVPLWQAILLPIAAILLFFLLLEGSFALLGIKPALTTEDPFVGFASNVPLFVPSSAPGARQQMTTAHNKLNYFNPQSFAKEKPANTYRIFTLGGSTTYGRPYNDVTSFSGWQRELLPVADRSKNWEVINAGGISYASYRIAHLMEELINYQPDLFIIYTGHNEFLEERTFSQIRDISPVVKYSVSLLAKTRTWSAMKSVMQKVGIQPSESKKKRDNLAIEVATKLDQSVGLDRYTRDDSLKDHILEHYRISLERMVGLARSAGAKVIFVTPASSLKDCTPFKSEHTQGLNTENQERSSEMLTKAKEYMGQENWVEALQLLDEAVALDPRHAELQYRRGQTLLALGRYKEAAEALRLARDEDVCPLRALTPIRGIVTEIAEEQGVTLVDYVDLLDKRMQSMRGYPIPGEEFFLDHVHPTVEGHKILALALIKAMVEDGVVHPDKDWGENAIARITAKIEGGIDKNTQGQALANLARVLSWAKKNEDAARLAKQAQEIAGDNRQVFVDATSILVTTYMSKNQPKRAAQLLYSTIEKYPGAIEPRWKLGEILLDPPFVELEEAAANLLLICQQLPDFDSPFSLFGLAMAKRGRTDVAYDSFMQAIRLNPNSESQQFLAQIRPRLGRQPPRPQPLQVNVDFYPSQAPRKLVQLRRDINGRSVPHGIEVEFYENGRVKRFMDIVWGVPNGLEILWDKGGDIVSRVMYRQGKPVNNNKRR
jgi:tetratricopeptide (TPR) repeat protein